MKKRKEPPFTIFLSNNRREMQDCDSTGTCVFFTNINAIFEIGVAYILKIIPTGNFQRVLTFDTMFEFFASR